MFSLFVVASRGPAKLPFSILVEDSVACPFLLMVADKELPTWRQSLTQIPIPADRGKESDLLRKAFTKTINTPTTNYLSLPRAIGHAISETINQDQNAVKARCFFFEFEN